MERDNVHRTDADDTCTTTRSFSDHDIEDGSRLVQRTYYRLVDAGRAEFAPTASFYDALTSAFLWAYLGTADETGVPEHVQVAIEDARIVTAGEFADRPNADLRTDVLTTFYTQVAGYHCAYRADGINR
jgi:hypothetical protein